MAQRKKILFLPEWYPNQNDPQLGVFVEKFARAASIHHQVAVIFACAANVNEVHTEIIREPFLLIRITYPKKKFKLMAARSLLKYHKQARKTLLEKWGTPDIVHLHMLFRNYVVYKRMYQKKIPTYFLTEQWSGYLNGNYEALPSFRKKFYRQAFAGARLVTSVSQRLKNRIDQLFSPANHVILPNIAEHRPAANKKDNTTLQLLVVADLVDEVKNISGIINAYHAAAFTKPSQLTIIGDGADRKILEEKASALPLSADKKIFFKGRLQNEDVLNEMNNAHFLVLNSNFETFSMVTAEALLSGIPVVSTRCGGPEEFLNENNSILVNVKDTSALAIALSQMEQRLPQFTPEKLSEPVLQKFGMEAVGQQLSDLYNQIKS